MDLRKYLAMKPQVDADVESVREEMDKAHQFQLVAQGIYDDLVTQLNNLKSVQSMLASLEKIDRDS